MVGGYLVCDAASNVVLYAQWFVTTGLCAGGLTAHYAAAPGTAVPVRDLVMVHAGEARSRAW
jgi:hypothetical protein